MWHFLLTISYIYQYKDHLGNTRISFGRNSIGALEITDANDYYPFGMNHLKTGNAFFGKGSYKNYKYNGKELQETGMYDYGARFYMPDLGRWGVIDPRSQYTHEAYSYVWNNPITFVDPTGMTGEEVSDWIHNPKTDKYRWDPNAKGWETTPEGWDYVGPTGSYRINGATVQLLEGGKTFTDIDEVAVSGTSPAAAGIVLSQNARLGLFAFLAVASWYVISDFVDTTPTQYGTRIDPMTHSPHTINSEAGSEGDKDVNGQSVPQENSKSENSMSFSKVARGNQRDSGLVGWSDEDIATELAGLKGNLSKEQKALKQKLVKEQKARTTRNKQKKSGEKGTGTGRR